MAIAITRFFDGPDAVIVVERFACITVLWASVTLVQVHSNVTIILSSADLSSPIN